MTADPAVQAAAEALGSGFHDAYLAHRYAAAALAAARPVIAAEVRAVAGGPDDGSNPLRDAWAEGLYDAARIVEGESRV